MGISAEDRAEIERAISENTLKFAVQDAGLSGVMEDEKFAAIVAGVKEFLPELTPDTIAQYMCSKWGDLPQAEHEAWLKATSANEIAGWVIAGFR